MVKIEIETSTEIMDDLVKEVELRNSVCMTKFTDTLDWRLDISQEFLNTILKEYKRHRPVNNLQIKINKKNEN